MIEQNLNRVSKSPVYPFEPDFGSDRTGIQKVDAALRRHSSDGRGAAVTRLGQAGLAAARLPDERDRPGHVRDRLLDNTQNGVYHTLCGYDKN